MGRAYEVRKASIQKTGAARSKIYTSYAKEIYQAAKTGGTELDSNAKLKRLVERARKEQVPNDIIKRAIDKVNSGVEENYTSTTYEVFGPAGSTFIIECLTDNVNRSVSDIRTVVNKCHLKMGAIGSISYNYDHLCIVSFKKLDEEATMDALIEQGVDFIDMEKENDEIIIYANPQDLYAIKDAISKKVENVSFDLDEIVYMAKEKITLSGEDLELFKRAISMFEEVEDVQHVYHNVDI